MTLFLRDSNKNTVLEVEFYEAKEGYLELHSSVIIDTYSKLLLNNLDRKDEVIEDFRFLSELRGWLWETVEFENKEYDYVLGKLKNILIDMGNKYQLGFITD